MSASRIQAQLDSLNTLHQLVRERWGPARKAMQLAASVHDGYPTTASGADSGPQGTGGHTAVERAVLGRLEGSRDRPAPIADLGYIVDFLEAATVAYNGIFAILDRYVAGLSDAERRALRCIGDGTPDGAVCDKWATRAGRCDACYMRARRAS